MSSGVSHDPDCPVCGCALHVFLPCECGCVTAQVNAVYDHAFDMEDR